MTMAQSRFSRYLLWPLFLALAAAGAYYGWHKQTHPSVHRYEMANVDCSDILQTVSANGTLSPVVLVNVGTQVSGTVKRLYADFNDRVRTGQLLAELDPPLFTAALKESQASLANAQASLKLAQANERRTRALYEKDYVARADLDQAQQALESARAQVELARAQVVRDQTNLHYSVIRSPVSGVVISRDVEEGQTVAASFQTPILFKIAQDLRRMQIDVSVSEADIGNLRVGQVARFSVDAFPDKTFYGKVSQIRLNATTQQNVVTYRVVVAVDNPEEILLPSMTAYVHIIVNQRENALRIPNAALRFRPKDEANAGKTTESKQPAGEQIVYRLVNNTPTPVRVSTGITDNKFTELPSGDLKAGDTVIIADLGTGQDQKEGRRFRLLF
jgi:RND family efflux transporter, MFP subunit